MSIRFKKYFEKNGDEFYIAGFVSCNFSFHRLDGWTVEDFGFSDAKVYKDEEERVIHHFASEKISEIKEYIGADRYKEIEEELIEHLFDHAAEKAEERKWEHSHSEE